MADLWTNALALFGASVAACNASAIARGGCFEAADLEAMHDALQQLAEAARHPEQVRLCEALRGRLPTARGS